jgi:pimeloyl-ACP methyl ester carboxylesterase
LPQRLVAECGTLTVYEDRATQSGQQINLHIAVLKARSRTPAPDPLFFLTGGPGQAATESYLQLSYAFAEISRDRDIVLVDQRGTGQSNPLTCPVTDSDEILTGEALKEWIRACRDQLAGNPRYYTTSLAMDDLDDVRRALGYDQINLYGVSYGTRAALTYLRQYPQYVRTVLLDGVVPSDEALGPKVAPAAQRALDMLFARCESDEACHAAFPDLRAEFESLAAQRAEKPVTVTLAHPVTGESTEVTLAHDSFVTTIRLLTYAPETVSLLPLLIHTAYAAADFSLLAAQTLLVTDSLESSISEGMGYSVLCSEDEPFFTEAQAEAAGAGTYLGDMQTEQLRVICAEWGRGDVPADFKKPVRSDVPVLLLSGEADPVTPPENGAHAAETLTNSLHLIAPGQGHNVIGRGCLPRVAADFVTGGTLTNLQTGCVADIQPAPFFVNFSGPQP